MLLHPNGFCAGFFHPLARRLRDHFRPVGVDLRGHGATDVPTQPGGLAYARMAADVLAVLDELGTDQVVALGVSLGGGVATVVDELRPGVLRKLVLCEAIAFDLGNRSDGTRIRDDADGQHGNRMSAQARKRTRVFPSRAAVLERYRRRDPLTSLAPEALEAYVRWGFHDRPDGHVELACPPEVEAAIFEMAGDPEGAPRAWAHLEALTCPADVLYGTDSDLPPDWFEAQAQRAGAVAEAIPGGHFFLFEDIDRGTAVVRDHMSEG